MRREGLLLRIWLEISRLFGWLLLDLSSSIKISIALEFWSASCVELNMDRFLMNLSIVIWFPGDILRRSLRTPGVSSVSCRARNEGDRLMGDTSESRKGRRESLTLKNHPVRHEIFHMALSLRENKEDVDDTAFDEPRQLITLINHTIQHQTQRIEHRTS